MHALVLLAALTAVSQTEVRSTMDRYVAAWLANDPAAVMQRLTEDSVLIPGAKAPLIGADGIRNYWWPTAGPAVVITRFDNTIDAITGSGDCAVVRGTQLIEWTTAGEKWRARGNSMTVLRKTATGWRIAIQFASSAPSERVP
jgi:uncharacterized protein (TIGR02246 family)